MVLRYYAIALIANLPCRQDTAQHHHSCAHLLLLLREGSPCQLSCAETPRCCWALLLHPLYCCCCCLRLERDVGLFTYPNDSISELLLPMCNTMRHTVVHAIEAGQLAAAALISFPPATASASAAAGDLAAPRLKRFQREPPLALALGSVVLLLRSRGSSGAVAVSAFGGAGMAAAVKGRSFAAFCCA